MKMDKQEIKEITDSIVSVMERHIDEVFDTNLTLRNIDIATRNYYCDRVIERLKNELIEALAEQPQHHGGFDNAETEIAWGVVKDWRNHIMTAEFIENHLFENYFTNLGTSIFITNTLYNAYHRINFTQLADRYKSEYGGE